MAAYWTMFAMWAFGAVQFARKNTIRGDKTLFAIAAILTALFVGLRFQVGGDWGTYIEIYELIYFQPLLVAVRLSDPGYAFANWLAAQGDLTIWLPNLICGGIFCAGLARLARQQPNPWLAVLVSVPYLVIVVAMGYTRQAAAIGILCWGLVGASERNVLRLAGFAAAAALFHKTAVLMLLVLLAPVITRRFLIGAIGALMFIFFAYFFLGSVSDRLVTNYVQSSYDSQGAAIRITMNVVAGVILLVLRNRMMFSHYEKLFWMVNALLALLSALALYVFESSVGVDRIALFLIPLQIVTYSRLPYALSGSRERALPSVLFAVMAYSFAVQFVWLEYADNANAWLPYRNFLWDETANFRL